MTVDEHASECTRQLTALAREFYGREPVGKEVGLGYRDFLAGLEPLDADNLRALVARTDADGLLEMIGKAAQSGNPRAVMFARSAYIARRVRDCLPPRKT